jgi:hypothetical protein
MEALMCPTQNGIKLNISNSSTVPGRSDGLLQKLLSLWGLSHHGSPSIRRCAADPDQDLPMED